MDNLETHDTRLLLPMTGFSIEPGIYIAGDFGVRSEINVALTARGGRDHRRRAAARAAAAARLIRPDERPDLRDRQGDGWRCDPLARLPRAGSPVSSARRERASTRRRPRSSAPGSPATCWATSLPPSCSSPAPSAGGRRPSSPTPTRSSISRGRAGWKGRSWRRSTAGSSRWRRPSQGSRCGQPIVLRMARENERRRWPADALEDLAACARRRATRRRPATVIDADVEALSLGRAVAGRAAREEPQRRGGRPGERPRPPRRRSSAWARRSRASAARCR